MTNKQIGQRVKSLLSQNKQLRQKVKELEKLREQENKKYQELKTFYLLLQNFYTQSLVDINYLQQNLEKARRQRNYYNRLVKDLRQQIKSMEENK